MGIPEESSNVEAPALTGQDVQEGHFYVIHCDSENVNLIGSVLNQVININEVKSPVLLGDKTRCSDAFSVVEYFTKLYRYYGLHGNEREMVLSQEDQIVSLQLCLAEYNKQRTGDFDVEVSRVLDAYKCLVEKKLNPNTQHDMIFEDQEFQQIKELYKTFCKDSNVVDQVDVLNRVKEEVAENEDLCNKITQSNFVYMTRSQAPVEKAMLKFLVKGKQVKLARAELPLDLDDGQDLESSFRDVGVATEDSNIQSVFELCELHHAARQISVTEKYVEKVVLGYLHLLVNSRSELALAQIINVPERGLDHKAFTDLKRAAKHKKMPMYQTGVSYIMRRRLGGKSYAPDPNVPLAQHVKGLGEFVDFISKLQIIVEEDTNSSSAIRRVLNAIKMSIVRCRDNTIRHQSVDAVNTRLQNHASKILEIIKQETDDSPKRNASAGGSMSGRKTLKIMRQILDSKSGQAMEGKCVEILTDGVSSQKTPIRFPCLMSQFRSPLEVSPDGKADRTLAERMKEKLKKKEKKPTIQRFQAHMDWAQPLHHVGFNKEEITIEQFIPSKTVVQRCAKEPKTGIARKVRESIHDQENVTMTSNKDLTTSSQKECSQQSKNIPVVPNKVANKKRTFGQACLEQPASKKVKKSASSSQSKSVKKSAALQKGQKQLTAFFRL